jgi:hypothetical protein
MVASDGRYETGPFHLLPCENSLADFAGYAIFSGTEQRRVSLEQGTVIGYYSNATSYLSAACVGRVVGLAPSQI